MKKYLLPQTGNFYKANLHCHSTVSDGCLTPEELKNIYKEQGYSVLAYTDHDVLISHNDLADENFLPLNGYEMEVDEIKDGEFRFKKTCHMCLIALDADNMKQVCYHSSKYFFIGDAINYIDKIQTDGEPDFIREHTHECISEMMRRGREKGFFVTYNHPAWSLEDYSDYIGYNNMHAMEICNYGSFHAGYCDYNEKEYDDMLRAGKRIYCIAADDNHNKTSDSFGGFTMIKAEKLEYKTITNALMDGYFYASQGPEIYELWFEDGKINISCSEAEKIILHTASRRTKSVVSEDGKTVNNAVFDVLPEDGYVRITIVDVKGKCANTNAYFIDELMK